jgi:hypothetical protein
MVRRIYVDKQNVKENVTNNDKSRDNNNKASWNQALRDAEIKLKEAQRQVMDWKAVVRVCGIKIAKGVAWPGQSTSN